MQTTANTLLFSGGTDYVRTECFDVEVAAQGGCGSEMSKNPEASNCEKPKQIHYCIAQVYDNEVGIRVFRRHGERFQMFVSYRLIIHMSRSVMIFAQISLHQKTPVMIVNSNLSALRHQNDFCPVVIPALIRQNKDMTYGRTRLQPRSFFMIRPCYVGRPSYPILIQQKTFVVSWKNNLSRLCRGCVPTTIVHLEALVLQRYFRNYVRSMKSGCRAVIRARRSHT